MDNFSGKIAVITGGGTGMGRELARQLVAQGASVAMCDLLADNVAETKRICEADGLRPGARVTTHIADVADEQAMLRFAAEVARDHATDHIHLLFNNAGIGGGASFINAPRAEWDRVFNICWNGVYLSCRAFMPMLLKADEGAVVNTSSANGFWAALGPNIPHTAYSAAKFAVKGFTEALINDFRNNAPHLKAHIVMPGGVGTPIGLNSRRILVGDNVPLTEFEKGEMRKRFATLGIPGAMEMDEPALLEAQQEMIKRFETMAPTTAAGAATIILDGVKAGRWRILVGEDVTRLDKRVRQNPEVAYEVDFAAYAPFAEGEEPRFG
ncbi:MAG: SDR family NAD(P)-dependent oxidoreductase [Dehalococcoidia bacterium]|nr:SDR family NAD(P)-dependent oxidoreductase [Dehalococcoidia bacterium]